MQTPWKAQYQTHRIARGYFKNAPNGLPGDDDVGAMSALYVFSALGLYPYVPGEGGFTLTGPLFERVTLRRPGGKALVINGKNAGPGAAYIQGLRLNGQPTSRLWLDWAALNQAGGVLNFEMGTAPNKSWGAAVEDAPPSYAPAAR
ncbi:MAG: glycoside hydrolase domain-containing protein [Hymenobacter sp.]